MISAQHRDGLTTLCESATEVLALFSRDKNAEAFWALDDALKLTNELRVATRGTVSELAAVPKESANATANLVVRSVRLQRDLAGAVDELIKRLRKRLILIAHGLHRRRALPDTLAVICEHLATVTGATVMCTTLCDRQETVLAAYPRSLERFDETFHVEIEGSHGMLGRLHVATAASPGHMATVYLEIVGQMLALAWSGSLHESALVRYAEWLECELNQVRAAVSSHRETDESMRELTRREQEVLTLLRRGETNAGIAQTLYVSVQTVKTHVKSILRKLGSASRTELIAPRRPSGSPS